MSDKTWTEMLREVDRQAREREKAKLTAMSDEARRAYLQEQAFLSMLHSVPRG